MNQPHQQGSDNQNDPVIIIGAGMVGVSTAVWLQREGYDVTLIDKNILEDRASFGNAGVLASSSIIPVTMPGLIAKAPKMVLSKNEPIFLRWSYLFKLLPWGLRYLSHANEKDARRIAQALTPIIGNSLEDHRALATGTPAENRIRPSDFAVLFKDKESFLKDTLPWDIRRDNGFSWTEREGSARIAYDSIFGSDNDFMAVLGGHGQITDPGGYLQDLINHFVKTGGVMIRDKVTDITQENGQVTGVVTTDSYFPTSTVAITAGAWSPFLTKKLGITIPLEAESGYHVEYWGANKMPASPTLVPSRKFILSPMEGRLRVAGAVEFGGLNNPGSETPLALLKSGVKELLPDLTFDHQTEWMGHRPAPSDSIPIIDHIPSVTGVYVGCGHQHVGLTGSARTGQLLANMICNKPVDIDMSAYRINRFGIKRGVS